MAFDPLDLVASPGERQLGAHPPIALTAPTIAAFIGRTERGPLNEPVRVTSFDEYRRMFGGPCAFSFVPLAVQHYFVHGGEVAVVVRVANRATRAAIEVPAGGETLHLQARQPGSREFLRVSIDYDRVEHLPERFNLVVQRVSRLGSQLVDDQELFQGLSMDDSDEQFVATALASSELVRLSGALPRSRPDATCAKYPGAAIPYLDICTAGTDGDELTDYDIVGSNKEGTGLFALDRIERVDLLCIPAPPGRDLGSTSFVAAERYCERRRTMLVWDPAWSWDSADAALLGLRATSQVSKNVVTYFPRLRSRGQAAAAPSGMPACGAVAGIIARHDRSGVWRALAPNDSLLKASLAPIIDLSYKQAAALQRFGVNVFLRAAGGSCVLQGNATFVGPNAVSRLWQSLNLRRLALFVLTSIEQSTHWALDACADASSAAELERQIWIFLSRLHSHGALAGATTGQALFVKADASASAPGGEPMLRVRFGIALRKPNEFLVHELTYAARRLDIHAVPALDADQCGT